MEGDQVVEVEQVEEGDHVIEGDRVVKVDHFVKSAGSDLLLPAAELQKTMDARSNLQSVKKM